MARFGSKLKVAKVPVPRNNPMGRVRPPLGMPHVAPPRIKPQKTRAYSKIQPVPNPAAGSDFGSSGFGDTGMSGES
jgi:hypothetical protein